MKALQCLSEKLICSSYPSSLKEFLPKEYVKNKGEKKIFQVRFFSFAC